MTPTLVLRRVGFTGTRRGMSERQKSLVRHFLNHLYRAGAEFHHGVCIGADIQAAEIAREIGYRTVGHPGPPGIWRDDKWVDDERRVATGYRLRNRAIVDECSTLLAAPQYLYENNHAARRSGTWQTINYAERVGRKREIFGP